MKCLVYLIVLTISVHGEFQYFRNGRASVSTVCTSSTITNTYCANTGCGNELIVCLGPNYGVSINCTSQYPYCAEDTPGQAQCIESCGSDSSDFSCTSEGVFPDPLDCKKYHFCQNKNNNWSAQSYSCPDRYVFDPDAANYCRYTNNYYCTLPKCGNSKQMKHVMFLYPFYPYNRQYYALCIPGIKPIVFKCQDGFVADVSANSVTCNFKCQSEGSFPNPDDSTKYFECYYNSKRQLVMRPGTCFPGYVFVIDKCQVQNTLATTKAPTNPPSTDQTTKPPTEQSTNPPSTDQTTKPPTEDPSNSTSNVEPTNQPTEDPSNSTSNVEPTNQPTENTSECAKPGEC